VLDAQPVREMVAEAINVEDGRQPVGRWHDPEDPTESGTIAGPMASQVMMLMGATDGEPVERRMADHIIRKKLM
jgi:hypothetical protein